MQVETYESTELDSGMEEETAAECKELIEKLALDGQRGILEATKANVMPYRRMTKEEDTVYGLICPTKTLVKDFKSHIMPLRILKVIEHAHSLNYFKELYIWHPEDATLDPVLVGHREEKEQYGPHTYLYILARWGEVLELLSDLKKKAGEVLKNKRIGALKAMAASANALLPQWDAMSSDEHLALGSQVPYCSTYIGG
jgi:hypothetical protein